jgi:hypothetical protein
MPITNDAPFKIAQYDGRESISRNILRSLRPQVRIVERHEARYEIVSEIGEASIGVT